MSSQGSELSSFVHCICLRCIKHFKKQVPIGSGYHPGEFSVAGALSCIAGAPISIGRGKGQASMQSTSSTTDNDT